MGWAADARKGTEMNTITIHVSGAVQTGKSAVLASIRDLLEGAGYCVAVTSREERYNPSTGVTVAAPHERPDPDKTVIVLQEHTEPRIPTRIAIAPRGWSFYGTKLQKDSDGTLTPNDRGVGLDAAGGQSHTTDGLAAE